MSKAVDYLFLEQRILFMQRSHRVVFNLNDLEMKTFARFCDEFGVKNKSKYIREVLITKVVNVNELHHPTLWGEEEMDSMMVKRAK